MEKFWNRLTKENLTTAQHIKVFRFLDALDHAKDLKRKKTRWI